MQDFNLSIGSLSIDAISKGIKDFLKCKMLFGLLFLDFPNMAVCAAAHQSNQFILFEDVVFNVFGHPFLPLYSRYFQFIEFELIICLSNTT